MDVDAPRVRKGCLLGVVGGFLIVGVFTFSGVYLAAQIVRAVWS